MADKLSVKDFATKIKAKYPKYNEIGDNDLVHKIVTKYPQYGEIIDFGVNWNGYDAASIIAKAKEQGLKAKAQPSEDVSYPSRVPDKATDEIPRIKQIDPYTQVTEEDKFRLANSVGNQIQPTRIPDDNVQLQQKTYDNPTLLGQDVDYGEIANNELVRNPKYINQININRLREENKAEIQAKKEKGKSEIQDYVEQEGSEINWNPFNKPKSIPIGDLSINTTTDLILDNTEKILNRSKKGDGAGSYFKGYYKTLLDPKAWDLGMSEMKKNADVKNVIDKLDVVKYDDLNTSEKRLLDAVATQTQAELIRKYDTSSWYSAGQGVAEMGKFIIELAGTGAIGKAALKTGEKALLEVIANKLTEGLAKHSLSFGTKVVAGMGKAGIAAAISPTTLTNAIGNMNGTVLPSMDGSRVVYGGLEEQQRTLGAFANAWGNQTKEYATEMSGGSLGVIYKYVKGIPGMEKVVGNLATTTIGKIGKEIANNKYVKLLNDNPTLKSLYKNNPLGEYNEEFDGAFVDHLFGTEDIRKSFLNWDAQAVLTLTLAPMSVFGIGLNATSGSRIKRQYEKTAASFTNTLYQQGYSMDEASEIKRYLLNATPENAGIQLQQILGKVDKDGNYILNKEGKIAFDENAYKEGIKYIVDKSRYNAYQGIKNPNALTNDERNDMITAAMSDGAYQYEKAQTKPNSGTLFTINNKVNEMEAKLGDEFAFMTVDELNDYLDTENLEDGKVKEIEDYLAERSLLNGAIQAMNDKAQGEIDQIHAEIDSTTRTDGTRLVVTTPEVNNEPSQTYYVIDGNVALDENGNVVRSASDTTLVAKNEKGEILNITINDIATASYQNAQETKQQIADDIFNRYAQQFSQEAETNPTDIKKEDGAEIMWFENGKPHQGIVIDKADGFVRIQEGNKIVVKAEAELNEEMKNPTVPYHLADTFPIVLDGEQYEGEITADADEQGKYTVHVAGHKGKLNYELTADEITALHPDNQTAPVAEEISTPPTEISTPPKTETAPVEELTPEQQAEKETEAFLASLPKIKTGNKAGRVDTKKLTPEQAFQYTKVTEDTETAIKDLKADIFSIDTNIRELEKKLNATTGTAKIDIREDIKELKAKREGLKTILDREAPGLEAEMKAQAEKKAHIEAEVKAKNEAIAEAQKNRVLTDGERENLHNNIISLLKEHNELPASHTNKKRAIFNEINQKASKLGYSVNVMPGGQFIVRDKEGKQIRTIAQRTSQEEVEAHPLLTEYAPEFQAFALKLMQSMPETLDFPNTNVEKAVKDILAGVKTVAANRMLDKMYEMFTNNEITIRATASTPEVVLSIQDYFATFEPETKQEQKVLDTIPDEILNELLNGGEMTDEISNYLNDLYNETYNQINGRAEEESPSNSIDRNAEESVSGQAEELNKRINPEKGTESASVVSPLKKEMQADTDGTGVVGKTTTAGTTSLQAQLDTQALDREQEAKAQEEKKRPELSIEEKKADIERRRKEELSNRVVYDRNPTVSDGEFRVVGDPNRIVYRINVNTGRLQDLDNSNGLWSNTAGHGIVLGSARAEGFELLKENINAKYDAELAALETAPSQKTEQQPVIEVRAKEKQTDQLPDVGKMIEKPVGATSTPKYKNGDTVTYKGKQYEINGIGKDEAGSPIYDLELNGKTVFEDVMESELGGEVEDQPENVLRDYPELNSEQPVEPKSIEDIAKEAVKKNEQSNVSQEQQEAVQDKVRGQQEVKFEEQATQDEQPLSAEEQIKPTERIEDFGEKIEGARKDQLRKYYNKINLNGLTLSTIFPKPDIKALLQDGLTVRQASAIKVVYEIAENQKKRYRNNKTKQLGGIKLCAAYAKTTIAENLNIDFMNDGWYFTDHGKKVIELRVAAYEAVAKELGSDYLNIDLKKVNISEVDKSGRTQYFKGGEAVKNVNYIVQYYVSATKYCATLEEAITEFVKQVKDNTKTDVVEYKRKLNVYSDRSNRNVYYIGYQPSGKALIKLKEGFKTSREAFDYKKENEAELQAILERIMLANKEENKKPITRLKYTNETARERVGKDWREGKDITTENFANTFGFRGIEYGNWVNQKERQVFLNNTYDSLMDLAQIIGVTPRAISLNGKLALSFGSRGSGGASAHYEPERVIINLTKTKGLGSLAHEWFHAVDNYFADFKVSMTSMKSAVNAEFKEGTRHEVKQAFKDLHKAFDGAYRQRSRMLDVNKKKIYFNLPHEIAARAFENYMLTKTSEAGQVNDFLANYVSPEEWKGSIQEYPYPMLEESKAIAQAFDNLFDVIQEDDNGVMFQAVSPIGFYSTVEKALETIQQERGTKDQFRAMLLKNGAKQAEMDWMGFDELPEKLTKADIQNWIDENRIEVKEVQNGGNLIDKNNILERLDELNDIRRNRRLNDDELSEYNQLSINYNNQGENTKYSQYVLPGGENYKELLLTMPEKFGLTEKEKAEKETLARRMNNEINMPQRDIDRYNELERKSGQRIDNNFKSSHFDEPNILAHVRFNERTVNGERVLFIEEIQSDWGQSIKKNGVKGTEIKLTPEEQDRFAELIGKGKSTITNEEWLTLLREGKAMEFAKNNLNQSEKDEFTILDEKYKSINSNINAEPNMPFKKTDQWVNLAARRMIRYAAENGFDRIAWTNGEQQAERYDLSKTITSINASKTSKGDYQLEISTKDNGIRTEYATEEKLPNLVGKELADKIVEHQKSEDGKTKTAYFSGLDLKVGGEGMKAFYDSIVPSAMSKLGKPFGAKVEAIEIPETGLQQSIPVTDSMKQTAMAGMPLYHTGTTMKPTTPEEVAATVEQLLKTGLAKEVRMVTPEEITGILEGNEQLHAVYHGSPHSFDQFSLDHIGTGEGAQAYGWGLYFTDKKEIAEGYAKMAKNDILINGIKLYDIEEIEPLLANYDFTMDVKTPKGLIEFAKREKENIELSIKDAERDIDNVNALSERKARIAEGQLKETEDILSMQEKTYSNIQNLKTTDEQRGDLEKYFKTEIGILNNKIEQLRAETDPKYHVRYIMAKSLDSISYDKELLESVNYILDNEKNISISKQRNLYTVNIHGDKNIDELNFLRWDKPINEEQKEKILNSAKNEGLNEVQRALRDGNRLSNGIRYNTEGNLIYSAIKTDLGSDKAASLWLLKQGIDGIQYPTEYTSKGEHEESYNYVVFDENALEITEHIQFMRTPTGTIYGFVKGGVVYLNSSTPNLNTPIHEFGHLWIDAIEGTELYNRGAELVKETHYWERVNTDPNYKDLSETARIKEAIVMAIGDNGESVVNDNGLKAKLKRWISDVWKRIGSAFGINNLTSEQISKLSFRDFVDIATSELLSGENLTENELSNPFRRLDKAYEAKEYEEKKEVPIRKALIDNNIPVPSDVWKDADKIYEPKRTIYNDNNIGVSLYKRGISEIKFIHSRYGHLLRFDSSDKAPQINKDDASRFRDLINPAIDRYVGMLQQVKHLSTPAAQQSINELIEDARLSKDYYDRYAAGEDVWRTEKAPRFQIIGEQGASNLDAAEEATTRMDNLQVAKEMEGTKTPLEIKQATGWERGADGKFRYETAKHTVHYQLQEFLNKTPDGFSKWYTARLNHKLNVNLIDIFGKDDETLKALPQLRNIPVKFASDADMNGAAGDYDPETKSIRLNVRIKADKDKIFSVLEHEVQHAIQEIEGFAKGGNASQFNDVKNIDNLGLYDVFDKIKSAKPKSVDEVKSLKTKILGDNPYMYESDNWNRVIRKIENGSLSLTDIIKTPYEQYHSLAGEVEARNAAIRKDYTPEQRRNTLLSETADVSPEDQIIIFDGLGVSMSMSEDEVQDKADKIKNDGLKSIIPDYTKFLSDVLKDCPKRNDIEKQASELGWDLPKAIEDYLATFANKGTSKAEMERVMKLLGLEDFSRGEVKMFLWDNANPNDGTPEWMAKRAMAYNNAKDNSIPKFPTSAQLAEYNEQIGNLKLKGMAKAKNFVFRFEESYMNQLASMRVFMDIVGKDGEVPDKYNPYYLAQLHTSAAQTSLERFEKGEYKTLMEAVNSLNKELKKAEGLTYLNKDYKSEKGTIDPATLYALAKAGLGRNERLAREEAEATYKEVYTALEAKHAEGKLTDEKYIEKKSKIDAKRDETADRLNKSNDYGGLTGLSDLVGSGAMDFEDVRKVVEDIVAEAEKAVNTDEFWNTVKKATSYSLKYQYDRGMMTKQMYEHVLNLEPHYLPLRGYDEETAGDLYEYFTINKGNFNPVLKKAKGHAHLPENPFAHLLSMTASGIMQAENNKVKLALLNLVENNKNDIISIKDTWIRNIGTEEDPEWVEAYPKIPVDATSEEVLQALEDFETQMQTLKQEGRATIKHKNLQLGLPIGKGVKSEHAITVKRNGQEQTLYVNGNPRLAQAINGMLNPDTQDMSKVFKFIRSINRGMSANFTSRNLEFAITNTMRDIHMAAMLSAIEEGLGYSTRLVKNVAICQRTIASAIFGTGTKGKYQDYWNEYLENGGQTGFVMLRSIEQYNKDVDKLQRAMNKRDALAIPRWVFKQIGDINNMAEQITRFATYVTSREAGRTPVRSAIDAKNITLNFNQKGSGEMGASWFQTLVLFFNPAMQALYRANQARQKHPARFWTVIGLHGASGAIVPALTFVMMALIAGDDDDELERYQQAYWNTPEWIRRNNLMIWIPGTITFLKYPLGQDLRWAYGIGEIGFTKAMGREKYGSSTGKQALESVSALIPVDVFGASHWYIPGFVAPVYEANVNENFMGKPFYKDVDKTMDQEDENDPLWTKAYKNTWSPFVGASKKLNEITGGDDITKGWVDKLPIEVNNPAINQHLVEGYLGGFVSVYFRTGELIGKVISGKPVSVNEVPMVRRLVSVADKQTYDNSTKREYYDIYNNLKETVGHQVNRCNKIINAYELRYNESPESLTAEEMELWGFYKDKLNNLKQTKDYYMYLEAKEADKAMRLWNKKGIEFNESVTMKQAIDNIKSIDEAEATKRVKAENEAKAEEEQVED